MPIFCLEFCFWSSDVRDSSFQLCDPGHVICCLRALVSISLHRIALGVCRKLSTDTNTSEGMLVGICSQEGAFECASCSTLKTFLPGNSLAVQWLELYTSTAGGTHLIPGWGTNIPHAASVQFHSVTQSCPTLCDPMSHSMPGLPVHHQLPEFTQTHVH